MTARYRFLLIQVFHLPKESQYLHRAVEGSSESMLMNYETVKPLLEDVEWALHRGPLATYGDRPVETREEFALLAAGTTLPERCRISRAMTGDTSPARRSCSMAA